MTGYLLSMIFILTVLIGGAAAQFHQPWNKNVSGEVSRRAAIARRSQRRLSRIAKGLRTRCYSPPLALARIAKGDGCGFVHDFKSLDG